MAGNHETPCDGCLYPDAVISPCPYLNLQSPKVVLVAQAPGSGALCSRHVCRYNWLLKPDDGSALMVDWTMFNLGVQDDDLLIVNALRCASQAGCYHYTREAENTHRGSDEYQRCAPALQMTLNLDHPKVVLLAGAEARRAFCLAFTDHDGIDAVKRLQWEQSTRFLSSSVTLLSHPGRLGLNARRRRAGASATSDVRLVYLYDIGIALKQLYPGYGARSAILPIEEFKAARNAAHPHPCCECHLHPGRAQGRPTVSSRERRLGECATQVAHVHPL